MGKWPNTPTIVSSNSSSTSVTGLQAGTHVFSLTVTDNNGAKITDMLSVVVLAGNATPTANAGSDQTITLPLSTVSSFRNRNRCLMELYLRLQLDRDFRPCIKHNNQC